MNNPLFDHVSHYQFPHNGSIIQEENSYNRESLLVSPKSQLSWSSFLRKQDSFCLAQQKNNNYIRPFELQEGSRTEQKALQFEQADDSIDENWKETEPDFRREKKDREKELEYRVMCLQKLLQEKTLIISKLTGQKQDTKVTQRPNKENMVVSSKARSPQTEDYFDAKSARRQIMFLTQNNLQLFEQVHRLSSICQELKQKVQKCQQKMKEQSKIIKIQKQVNASLMKEKQDMMAGYQEELDLFKRMKRVWEEQCRDSGTNRTSCTTSRSSKAYHSHRGSK